MNQLPPYKIFIKLFLGLLMFSPFLSLSQTKTAKPAVDFGVTKTLADDRSAKISNIKYSLDFNIPLQKAEVIMANETISFSLKSKEIDLQIDFKGEESQFKQLVVNGKSVAINYQKEHLIIDATKLLVGQNSIQIKFIAGNGALNRNDDYLYTLFVPDRARTVFPCFDQPNLKAIFTLSLEVPSTWNVLANGNLKSSVTKNGRKTCVFLPSDKISTYLFSFTAGKFTSINQNVAQKTTQFLYRETDFVKIKESVDSIFNGHTEAINFLEKWTAIPYPFQKVGFVAIPDFQFGGMEHVGAVQYQASTLFLDDGATKDKFIARSNLISHETAHMWFGDLVSINWFNDVWMKEVFANFMADKVSEKLAGKESFDLKFLIDHFPAAYGIDRTLGANPIRQQLDNLNEAGALYGNIIYHKAPIMMRQLERLMGKENFQAGVQAYLKKFAYGNASWPDLINILNQHSKTDLLAWNKVWVNDSGRPVIDYKMELLDGKISKFTISQTPEFGLQKVWPQISEVTLFYPNYTKELTVNFNKQAVDLLAAIDLPKPLFILFNSGGEGYGVWPVDAKIVPRLNEINSPLHRASAYVSLYENMLNKRGFSPKELLNIFINNLHTEQEELNLRLLTNYINTIYWEFTSPQNRTEIAAYLENKVWEALQFQASLNNKKNLLKAYQNIFTTDKAYQNLYSIWKNQQAPEGIKLTEDDYTSLAFSLKLRNDKDVDILATQLERIKNPDRKKRFEFITPALSADEAIRDAFFESLKERKNREKEANVTSALGYLHHPLRQKTAVKYLKASLDLLEEIRVTGDIFFPQSWLQAIFSNYQYAAANQIVIDFLAQHPQYNSKLKAKILQTTDNLARAQKLVD
jgi:aminopeptidase N